MEATGAVTTWSYDPTYQLTREQREVPGGPAGASFDYSYNYDCTGNRTLQTDHLNSELVTYSYDAANELITSQSIAGLTTHIYDAAGNLTEKQAPMTEGGTVYYGFDDRNRMANAEVAEGIVTFTYNAEGQRKQKLSTDGTETGFLYDGKKLLQELDDNDDPTKTYTATIDEYGDLISEYDESLSDTTYGSFNAEWSADAWIDENQTVSETYRYRAFGLTSEADPATPSEPGPKYFGGQLNYYADLELDLYLLGIGGGDNTPGTPGSGSGRYYDPDSGRFLAEDPLGEDASNPENLYSYVQNNPLNANDPSGQERPPVRHSDLEAVVQGLIRRLDKQLRDNLLNLNSFADREIPKLGIAPSHLEIMNVIERAKIEWITRHRQPIRHYESSRRAPDRSIRGSGAFEHTQYFKIQDEEYIHNVSYNSRAPWDSMFYNRLFAGVEGLKLTEDIWFWREKVFTRGTKQAVAWRRAYEEARFLDYRAKDGEQLVGAINRFDQELLHIALELGRRDYNARKNGTPIVVEDSLLSWARRVADSRNHAYKHLQIKVAVNPSWNNQLLREAVGSFTDGLKHPNRNDSVMIADAAITKANRELIGRLDFWFGFFTAAKYVTEGAAIIIGGVHVYSVAKKAGQTVIEPLVNYGMGVALSYGVSAGMSKVLKDLPAPVQHLITVGGVLLSALLSGSFRKTLNRGTGPLRDPARRLLKNEDVLIDATHGLQSRMAGQFDDVMLGKHADDATKYLWTIDERGINIVQELTPFPTPRGNVVHSNLSQKASIGGEVWFESADTVIINAGSGRFGDGAGITRAQWNAAIRYWEILGYNVKAIPFGSR